MSYFISVLSKDERQKADRFKFPRDRNCFIISRGILRCLLGKYLGKAPRDIEIIYGLWGKPCLPEQPLYFNLSHSKDYALCAIVRNYEVGIDLEYIYKKLDLDSMILNILSPQEIEYWKTVKTEEKTNTFFKLWVSKEAFLKASGKGWLHDQYAIPWEGLELLIGGNRNYDLKERMAFPYYFESIPGYASAFFIEGPFLRPLYYTWKSLM
jgi:4'-phosphopantetheinyl transferase